MVLTLDDAERIVRNVLDGAGAPGATILRELTIERPFGWVLAAMPVSNEPGRPNPAAARFILVNKFTGEVFEASPSLPVLKCVDNYEGLLRAHSRGWCLTMNPPGWATSGGQFTWLLKTAGLTVLASRAS